MVNNAATKPATAKDGNLLEISDGYFAKSGDKVIDIQCGVEGKLYFGLWYWYVKWEDFMETIVYDPFLLKIKE